MVRGYNYMTLLMSFLNISMGLNDLFERIGPVDDGFQFSFLHQLLKEIKVIDNDFPFGSDFFVFSGGGEQVFPS